jgi:hypothetical protein
MRLKGVDLDNPREIAKLVRILIQDGDEQIIRVVKMIDQAFVDYVMNEEMGALLAAVDLNVPLTGFSSTPGSSYTNLNPDAQTHDDIESDVDQGFGSEEDDSEA